MKKTPLPGILVYILLVAVISLSYHDPFNDHESGQEIIDPPFLDTANGWVDSVYGSLSDDERIAQFLMVAVYPSQGPDHIQNIVKLIKKHNVGGILMFQGSPHQHVTAINRLQAAAKTPLLVSIDAEWGLGMRIDSTISYPRQMMLGAIQDNNLIYQMGFDIAAQLKRMGIHMNFAPVVDVNNNPMNPVINSRSFGEEKKNVAAKGLAYIKGMQDAGILCTAKHFPGHGDTDMDSHLTLPTIPHSRNRLESIELYPFIQCIRQGLAGVMIAHLYVPALDSISNQASSLSHQIVENLLKKELGFKGLVVTDALNMKGVSDYYQPGELEAKALLAGNDILVMPGDIPKAIRAIKREIRKKNITRTEIEERCKKILMAKKWIGLDEYEQVPIENLYEDINQNRYKLTRTRLVESALTLLKNEDQLLPLERLDTLKIASLAIGSDTINQFQQYLNLYTQVDPFTVSKEVSGEEMDHLISKLEPYNLVIIGVHNTDMRVTRNYGITDQSIHLIQQISDRKPVILSVFANPYSLQRFNEGIELKSLIMSYEDNDLTQQFAGQLIFGGIPARGQLPVTVNMLYKAGSGLSTGEHFRFKYSLPEDAGMNSKILEKIDSIIYDAIALEVIPGCQVLAARNGVVFYHKAFGYHTYAKKMQ